MYELVRVGHDELVGGKLCCVNGSSIANTEQRSFESKLIELLSKYTRRLLVLLLEIQF
jgi:hypothetical protein